MCINNCFYPLVVLDDGSKKVLFDCGVHINSYDTFDDMLRLNSDIRRAVKGFAFSPYLNKVMKKNDVVEVKKMVSVPCGICKECLNDYSKEWALKIMLETKLHSNNYFITFTYDEENCPRFLIKDEISKFNKKLKTYLDRAGKKSDFRFYGVGEYGSTTLRPHYHVIYFGLDLDDLKFYKNTPQGNILYNSPFLDKVWNKGFVVVGDVDVESACYVARYCEKKRRLTKLEKDKLIADGIEPEFSVMSRRPGIGSNFYDYFKKRFENGNYKYFIKGGSFSIPKAWMKRFKLECDSNIVDVYDFFSNQRVSAKISCLLDATTYTDVDRSLKLYNKFKNKRM